MTKSLTKYALLIALIIIGYFSDQHTKTWAKSRLQGDKPVIILNGFIDCNYTENRGMVFGFLNDSSNTVLKTILLGIRILILIGVAGILLIKRKKSFFFLLPFAIIVAGAGGNIADLLRFNFVTDFMHIHFLHLLDWPYYFNLADAYLCIGIVLLLLKELIKKKPSVVNGLFVAFLHI